LDLLVVVPVGGTHACRLLVRRRSVPVALLAGLRGDRLVARPSFFQLDRVRKARRRSDHPFQAPLGVDEGRHVAGDRRRRGRTPRPPAKALSDVVVLVFWCDIEVVIGRVGRKRGSDRLGTVGLPRARVQLGNARSDQDGSTLR